MTQLERVKKWRKENPDLRRQQKRREKITKRLRDLSILPQSGMPLDDEQNKIINEIKNDSFIMPDKWSWIRLQQGRCYLCIC
jgi:hypothetical protein